MTQGLFEVAFAHLNCEKGQGMKEGTDNRQMTYMHTLFRQTDPLKLRPRPLVSAKS